MKPVKKQQAMKDWFKREDAARADRERQRAETTSRLVQEHKDLLEGEGFTSSRSLRRRAQSGMPRSRIFAETMAVPRNKKR